MALLEINREVTRRYAKYVFLDVVQFSERSAEAQSEIVEHLNEIIRQALSRHEVNYDEDCILIPTGDGMCIALISPDLPYDVHIQMALSILESLDNQNEAMQDQTRQFKVRVGINQNTDILITDINGRKNIAGAGINLASRIMDKADGGQILVSQAVFHELHPSEVYMNKFKSFTAIGKHNVSFQVHQYTEDEHKGLSKDLPSAFVKRDAEKKKLNEETAHYLAQAIMHRQELLRIKSTSRVFDGQAAVILLRLLSNDAYRLSKASEFDDAPMLRTNGAGKISFEEQFIYYASQDFWVLREAEKHITNNGLELSQYLECFEYGDYIYHYEFVSTKGIEKLKEEWPNIWETYELDKYI